MDTAARGERRGNNALSFGAGMKSDTHRARPIELRRISHGQLVRLGPLGRRLIPAGEGRTIGRRLAGRVLAPLHRGCVRRIGSGITACARGQLNGAAVLAAIEAHRSLQPRQRALARLRRVTAARVRLGAHLGGQARDDAVTDARGPRSEARRVIRGRGSGAGKNSSTELCHPAP